MNKTEWQAVQWLRTSHTGRKTKQFIERKVTEAREVYEKTPANESQRLLLQAYKLAHKTLFHKDLKDIP